jgi:hypothetical protein
MTLDEIASGVEAKYKIGDVMKELPRTTIQMESGFKNIPEGSLVQTLRTDNGAQFEGHAYPSLNQVSTPEVPLSRAPRAPEQAWYNNLTGSLGSGANKSIAGLAGLPVDAATGAMNFLGADIQEPVGGSAWIKNNLLPKEYPSQGFSGRAAEAIGEQLPGLMLPGGIALREGQAAIPAMRAAVGSAAGAATGVTLARTALPASGSAELAGAILGGGIPALGSVLTSKVPNIDKLITYNLNKAIRPSASGKNVASDISKYEDKGVGVVKSIVQDSRERGVGVPQSVSEMGQAIESLRSKIYQKYHQMTTATGERGVSVNLSNLTGELDDVIANKAMQDFAPEVINFARDQKAILLTRGTYTPQDAEEAIQLLNSQLKAYYAGRSTGISERKAVAMAGVATKLRGALDTAIESVEGSGYQDFKNQYGQLKAIEKDVVRGTVVDKRASTNGFFDLSDMFSAGKLVTGIMKADPATAAAGGTMLAVKRYLKMGNDPNRIVKTMFNKVEKYMPPEQKFYGPADRELGFEMQPHTGETTPSTTALTRTGRTRDVAPTVVDGQYTEVTPLPPGRAISGLLDSPRNTTPINAPWKPVLRTGAGGRGVVTNQGVDSNVNLQEMSKRLYGMGYPPSQIQDYIQQEITRRGLR